MSAIKKKLKFDANEVTESNQDNEVFNLNKFNENLHIQIHQNNPESLQFDITGIDASVANALRRIMIAEVPTMAFHKVFLFQNTSVLPDELLVHRLGLLPVKVDPKDFKDRKPEEELNESNSLKFRLKAVCKRKEQYKRLSEEEIEIQKLKPEEYLENCNIYSKDLQWVPMGNQKQKLKNVKLVYDNILISKLRENQEIYLEIYAEKGIGKRHTKWSPVATTFYRLMPQVTLNDKFDHEKYAQTLTEVCPGKVFKLKKNKAIVSDPRSCTTCRECLKLEGVQLQKLKEHFIFKIESTGILNAQEILYRALEIMEEKAKSYLL